jgi:hypothetical protein
MLELEKYFDPYERKARVYPALLVLLPLIISVSFNYPELYSSLTGLVALVAAMGGVHLIAHAARDAGKKKEAGLFESWGGIPSVTILRYSDQTIPKPAKGKLHAHLANITGIDDPSIEDEKSNAGEVDEIYRSWSDHLRVNARDTKKHNLLFQELINYGFRRNVYGMKYWYSISGILALSLFQFSGVHLTQVEFGVMLIIAAYSIYFTVIVNSEWVRTPSNEYAKRLIETTNY